jgi:hypothetical protein
MSATRTDSMEKSVSLCKRRGFVFQASEIYGGIGNTYDYGPLGVELLRRVKDAWWNRVVVERADVVGLDSAIIQHPKVWETRAAAARRKRLPPSPSLRPKRLRPRACTRSPLRHALKRLSQRWLLRIQGIRRPGNVVHQYQGAT